MKTLITTSMITAIIVAAATPASAQSFSCRNVSEPAERAVCASRTLRKLDRQMTGQYRYARRFQRSAYARGVLVREQRAWLRSRNNCGRDRECLDTIYRIRMAELDRAVDASNVTIRSRPKRTSQRRPATSQCNIRGFSIDRDPNGLNVRFGPGRQYGVIAQLRRRHDSGSYIAPEIEITGVSGKWLRIRHAQLGIDGRTLFKGVGWVNANLVATSTRASYPERARLRQRRARNSRTVARLPSDMQVRLRGCTGRWPQVAYQGKRGWLAPGSHCGSAQTSCN